MTNPTSNYGFVLPTATDLVTDLPADFEVALQGVDTRLKALQPGTTLGDIAYSSATANVNTRLGVGTNGQVLAVSGGVPAWTTTADVTPLTTKGDLFTFDTADARLGVGTNGQILVADSTASTGLKWATPAASASGLTLITSQTLSAVNSVSIDNCFTTTYDNYLVMASVVISSGANVQVRMRAGGSTNTTSDYDFFNERVRYDNTIAIADTGLAQSSWNYMGSIGSAAGYYSTIALNFFAPKLARNTTLRGIVNDISTSSSVFAQYNSVGNFRSATAFDGFYLAMTGAPTMTGEIRVYGYQNS